LGTAVNSDFRKILFLLVGVIAVAYPFVVFFGLDKWGIANLALLLLAVVLLRFVLTGGFRDTSQIVLVVIVGIFCGGVYTLQSEGLLKLYPVIMSLSLAFIFGLSLFQNESIIEKFARRMGKQIGPREKLYTRRLTGIWVGLLVLNACVAWYTSCCMSLKSWSYYNGFLSYVIFITFFFTEFLYRYFFIVRKEAREVN